MVASLAVLGISHNLAKHNAVYHYLPSIVYGGISGTFIWSFLENLSEYGVLNKIYLKFIKDKLNPSNWFKN